jgi:hypothetical protein
MSPFDHASRDQRGSIAAIGAITLAVVIATAALAVEAGHWYVVRQTAQRTADLAAIAGAYTFAGLPNAQVATNSAADAAELNGAQGGTRSWDAPSLTTTDSLISSSLVASPTHPTRSAVEVTVSSTVPLLLAKLFMAETSISISASAWAEVTPPVTGGPACVLSLSQTGTGLNTGVNIGGNPQINLTACTLRSDSDINVFGAANVTATGVYAAGGISGSNNIVTQPIAGQYFADDGVIADPYAGDIALQNAFGQLGSGGPSLSVSPNQTQNFTHGVYSSLDIQGTANLGPGLYIVNGPVTFDAKATVIGNGVTIISSGAVTINGGATLNLTAPPAGDQNGGVPGVVLASTDSSSNNKLNGGSTSDFTGAIYFPHADIEFTGNSANGGNGCTQLIANAITFKGSATFGSNCAGSGTTPIPSVPSSVTLVK